MKNTLLGLAAACALLASPAAFAQGYVGAGAGTTRIDVDCAGATTCDKTDTGYKVFGGYRFGNNFAGELVYFDWGKVKATEVLTEGGVASGEGKATGFGIGAAYFIPFATQWQGVLRLGVASNRAKGNGTLGGSSGSVSETSSNAYYGVGIGYRVSNNLSIDGAADFSRIRLLGEKANTQLLSIGVTYSF